MPKPADYEYVDFAALDPSFARDIAIAKKKREQAALIAAQQANQPKVVAPQPGVISQFQEALRQRVQQEVASVGNPFASVDERTQAAIQQRRREEAKTFGQ